ncbi:ATP-binding protein [Alkalinema pantanalense CENA528]|uniref:hybrid sensor histidine kinase/response regulator n=1 Tax=Alkalinema pantanalense TaxID=1620705 RepID=UPI003D70114A
MLSKPLKPMVGFASSGAKRILLVKTLSSSFRSMHSMLKKRGYHVDSVHSGFDALVQMERYPPDLLLLDTETADIDGYEITRRVRKNPELPFFPIMLVGEYNHSNVVKGFALGANDVIPPMVKKRELFARILAMLRFKDSIDEQIRINQQHEEFIASLTHDLRTPLIAADHVLHLLRRGAFGNTLPKMRDSLEQVAQSNQTLLEMVDTLLEIYQYEAGCKDLYFHKVNLWELSQSVVKELVPLAVNKGLMLSLCLATGTDETSLWMGGDRLELRRLITNLISNAIRYTETGSVELHLEYLTHAASEKNFILLGVKDTGVGISPEEQECLFERFRQGNPHHPGNGLGLYLSRQIVEAHHGSIEVESEVGKGTLFKVQFDLLHP